MTTGSLNGANLTGDIWSSTVIVSASYAYNFDFSNTSTFPSLNYHRWTGFTVRITIRQVYDKSHVPSPTCSAGTSSTRFSLCKICEISGLVASKVV